MLHGREVAACDRCSFLLRPGYVHHGLPDRLSSCHWAPNRLSFYVYRLPGASLRIYRGTFCFSVPFSMRKTCARRAEVGVPVYLYLSGLYLSIDLSIYLSIYLSILSICICVCVCLYIYMYMCVCVCMCIYIYIECPKGVGSNGTCNMQHDPSLIIKAPTVDDIDPASPIIRNIPEFP